MERLTRKELGNITKAVLCNYNDTDCNDSCKYGFCKWSEKAFEKLKAYEDAEEQGLLLRLPCKVGDTVWTRKFPTRIDEEDGTEWTICDIKRATVVPTKFNLFMLAKWGDLYFLTKEEAEQKLESMKGE